MRTQNVFLKLLALPLVRLFCSLACCIAPAVHAQNAVLNEASNTAFSPASSEAQASTSDTTRDRWSLHAQSTFVWQRKSAFDAPYTGPQSLRTAKEYSHSWSATAFLGVRLWEGAEFYLNPESVASVPLSDLYGLASASNGENQKNGGPIPREYLARFFVRQTFGLGGEKLHVDDGPNQVASTYDRRRIVLTAGKLTQTDIFEKSGYANDSRSQFSNWALITHGAWDYAADARSYTIGFAGEWYIDDWVGRVGRFMEPETANGTVLNYNIGRVHGDQFELEHNHVIGDLPGAVRFMAFRNRAFAGNYRDAINAALTMGGTPDVTSVRKIANKTGFGISLQQRVASEIGLFLRASTADDKVEEYAFTEIDNTVSGGLSVQGNQWHRPNDTFGIAFSTSGLNRDHRDYLAAGGLGGFLGDGQLKRYGRESVIEAYYNMQFVKGLNFTLDFQRIANPGYNADRRGPVRILGGRLHWEL